jgi:hypothetical protein
MYFLLITMIVYFLYMPFVVPEKQPMWKKFPSCYICGRFGSARVNNKIVFIGNMLMDSCYEFKNHTVCFDCNRVGFMFSGCYVCLKMQQHKSVSKDAYYFDELVKINKIKRVHKELLELFRKKFAKTIE